MSEKRGVYEIAKYIPLKIRRQMVAVTYRMKEEGRMCATGRCPMGWLFADPPKGRKLLENQAYPSNPTIARRIKKLFPGLTKGVGWGDLIYAAEDFTRDWDAGAIKSLRKALGVPNPEPHV